MPCAIVFIDDIVGTGKQAVDNISAIKLRTDIKKVFISLVAQEEGLQHLINSNLFVPNGVDCGMRLSSVDRAFALNSRLFQGQENISENDIIRIKETCLKYGKRLNQEHPLGYKDSQLLITFLWHNTPNNTLPVIWAGPCSGQPSWNPLFERKEPNRENAEKTEMGSKNKFPIIKLPRENHYFTGRTKILNLIYENFKNGDSVARVQLLRGLGGVGKTSIALKYAYTHRDEYETVWWVNAENSDSVLLSYRQFLLEQKIISEDAEIGLIVKEMQFWFMHNKNWFFVFDNADAVDIKGGWLEEFLPNVRNGHVLITTRSWDAYIGHMVSIDVFTETEALLFLGTRVRKSPEDGIGYSEDLAKELVRRLQYLPLALEQAGAYIRAVPEETYRGYINLLAEYGVNVFDEKIQLVDYSSTITATWKISMARITNESAIQMFNMCAYLAPDAMPVAMFIRGNKSLPRPLQRELKDYLKRNRIITDLGDYSLIKFESDESIPGEEKRLLYMHRLVQEVVQKEHRKNTRWLVYCLDLIRETFNWNVHDKESIDVFNIEFPHALTVAEKSQKVFVKDNEKLEKTATLFFGISAVCSMMRRLDLAKSCSDKCIEISERLYKIEVAVGNNLFQAYNNRGIVYVAMMQYDKAIEDFDRSVEIGKQLYRDNQLLENLAEVLALAYMNKGIACEYKTFHEKALPDKNKSIEIYEHLYKTGILENENGIALAYMNRGATYEAMEKYAESLSDSKKSIEIWEKMRTAGKVIDEIGLEKARQNVGIAISKSQSESFRQKGAAEYHRRNARNVLSDYRKQRDK